MGPKSRMRLHPLTLNNVEPRHAGEYTVTVSNRDGSVESPAALLKVQVPVVVVPPDLFRPPSFRFTNYLANLAAPAICRQHVCRTSHPARRESHDAGLCFQRRRSAGHDC